MVGAVRCGAVRVGSGRNYLARRLSRLVVCWSPRYFVVVMQPDVGWKRKRDEKKWLAHRHRRINAQQEEHNRYLCSCLTCGARSTAGNTSCLHGSPKVGNRVGECCGKVIRRTGLDWTGLHRLRSAVTGETSKRFQSGDPAHAAAIRLYLINNDPCRWKPPGSLECGARPSGLSALSRALRGCR